MYPRQVLRELNNDGIIIDTMYWDPELYSDPYNFHATIVKHHVSLAYIENNIALFVLCQNQEGFKKRIDGITKDKWLTKQTFEKIAKDCYNMLAKQNDLQEWQVKLMGIFKDMF